MYLICDWEDSVAQYNLPSYYRAKLEEICDSAGINLVFCSHQDQWPEVDQIVAYVGNRPEAEILLSTSLQWIHFGSVGTDRISSSEASKKGVVITNSQGIFDEAVALHAVSRLLNRLIPRYELQKQFDFNRTSWEQITIKAGSSLFHVLGNGPIAQRLCMMLVTLGLKVRAYTRTPSKYDVPYDVVHFDHFDQEEEEVNRRNFVINLLPACDGTAGFVGSSFLKRFSSIYYYLNIGRPQTESLSDIRTLMRSRIIEYAGWDVIRDKDVCVALKDEFNQRVDFTPHIAAFTDDHWSSSFELLQKNINCFLLKDYKSMDNRVNA
jgi:lactate dehydrogenase-like 2-hydroxyacid dehydrogenase